MPQLDNYLVTLGVKGQNVVLAQMEKIRKGGKDISKKKTVIDLVAKGGKGKASSVIEKSVNEPSKKMKDFTKDLNDGGKKLKQYNKNVDSGTKQTKESTKAEKESTLSKVSKTAAQGASEAGHGIASMDVNQIVGGITGMVAKAGAAGMIIGGAAKIVTTGFEKGPELGKATSKEANYLYTRDSATQHYGEGINRGRMSNNEKAQFVAAISGSFGKIQKPMTDIINKLSPSKDTGALARVAGGNWKSTGTDKGFFLQKLSDSFGDLPPSIAQKFQSRLLENYGESEIQNATKSQKGAQATDAAWSNRDDLQAKQLYGLASQKTDEMMKLNERNLGTQRDLAAAALSLGKGIEKVAEVIDELDNAAASAAKSLWNVAKSAGRKVIEK